MNIVTLELYIASDEDSPPLLKNRRVYPLVNSTQSQKNKRVYPLLTLISPNPAVVSCK